MKIECIKEKLLGAVQKAERVTGKNLALPILKTILLEASESTLKIRATNMDIGVEIEIPVKVNQPGSVAVSGGVLMSLLQNLYQDKNITLELGEGGLSVITPNNTTLIKVVPHDDFPIIPRPSYEIAFSINSEDFLRGIKSVWYSSAVTNMKPELSSVYIYQDQEGMVFVATDSFRLAEKRVKTKKPIKEFTQILIPFKNVPEIIRVLDEIKDEIDICLDKNQISFTSKEKGVYLTSRVIDGAFPDYHVIIPKEWKTEVVVLKNDLINSLKLVNVFSDQFHQVNIQIKPNKKLFELKTKNADVGENVNKVEAKITGESLEINVNYKYLTDCFQSIQSDSVVLEFNGLNRPIVVKASGNKDFLYLVMPMNR